MSLNVTITQPITLYHLEQYRIPLKPLLGGVRIVALTIISDEQTESAVFLHFRFSIFLRDPFFQN